MLTEMAHMPGFQLNHEQSKCQRAEAMPLQDFVTALGADVPDARATGSNLDIFASDCL